MMNFTNDISFFSFFLSAESFNKFDFEKFSSAYLFAIFLLNLFSYFYLMLKFYKIFCYFKLTVEWFPMVNPYEWPFSFFYAITMPYFKIWAKILPPLKFQKSSFDISTIVALEALNALIYLCVRATNVLIILLQSLEKLLQS